MCYIMNDLNNLKNNNISLEHLDKMVDELYCNCFRPVGFMKGDYRVYKYNDMLIAFKCLFVKEDKVIRKNVVKILDIKAI